MVILVNIKLLEYIHGSQSALSSANEEALGLPGGGIIEDILSIADPPPLSSPVLSPLDPDIPFLLICNFAKRSLIKSPPPLLGASFSARFFCFRSLAFLSLALPAPPALRMAAIRSALPASPPPSLTAAGVSSAGAEKIQYLPYLYSK